MIAWRFAAAPTRRSPVFVNATTEGVRRLPSALGMTTGSPASITATTELVVPRSIPTVLGILMHLHRVLKLFATPPRPLALPLHSAAPAGTRSTRHAPRRARAVAISYQPLSRRRRLRVPVPGRSRRGHRRRLSTAILYR